MSGLILLSSDHVSEMEIGNMREVVTQTGGTEMGWQASLEWTKYTGESGMRLQVQQRKTGGRSVCPAHVPMDVTTILCVKIKVLRICLFFTYYNDPTDFILFSNPLLLISFKSVSLIRARGNIYSHSLISVSQDLF